MKVSRLVVVLVAIALLVVPVTATHMPNHGTPPGQGPGDDPEPQPPHPAQACSQPYHVHGAGWDLCWQLDDVRVQGLEVNRAFFHNESVIWKMGVPFTLTKYERPLGTGPFKDVLGRPADAGVPGFGRGSMQIDDEACPRFHPTGELLADGRLCVERREGVNPAVALWARYDVFNYRFLQGYTFDSRGEVEPFIAMGGHLIDGANIGADGQNHYHHLYWRVDFDVASPDGDVFQAFKHLGDDAGLINVNPNTPSLEAAEEEGVGICEPRPSSMPALWCDVRREAILLYDQNTYDKWRVVNKDDLNSRDRAKSFEFNVHSDAPADTFSRFDVMVLQHQGDSAEIGYEVPTSPLFGDDALRGYMTPPEVVTDPVVWVVHHAYHDTRDEDRHSMAYHYAGINLRPNNFLNANPAEPTFP